MIQDRKSSAGTMIDWDWKNASDLCPRYLEYGEPLDAFTDQWRYIMSLISTQKALKFSQRRRSCRNLWDRKQNSGGDGVLISLGPESAVSPDCSIVHVQCQMQNREPQANSGIRHRQAKHQYLARHKEQG